MALRTITGISLALLLPGALDAQVVPPGQAPPGSIDLGAFQQNPTQGYGPWRGQVLDATWNPWRDGKFVGALVRFDRPEGKGTVASLGKYQEFRGGYGFLGLATGSGADYLPSFQVNGDLDLQLPAAGWVAGGALSYTRVRDGHTNLQAFLGPTLYAAGLVATVRLFRNRSNPGGLDSSGTLVQVRHGLQDHLPWQSLRVTWGGEAYQSLLVHEAVQGRGASAALDFFFPVAGGWTLQPGVEWGQKNGAYHFWGTSLRVGRLFF